MPNREHLMRRYHRKATENLIGTGRIELKAKEIIMPGVWVDENDALHISIPDLLDSFGWPHDEEHMTEVEKVVQQVVKKQFPDVRFVAQGACPNCGATGKTPRAEHCVLK